MPSCALLLVSAITQRFDDLSDIGQDIKPAELLEWRRKHEGADDEPPPPPAAARAAATPAAVPGRATTADEFFRGTAQGKKAKRAREDEPEVAQQSGLRAAVSGMFTWG